MIENGSKETQSLLIHSLSLLSIIGHQQWIVIDGLQNIKGLLCKEVILCLLDECCNKCHVNSILFTVIDGIQHSQCSLIHRILLNCP
jgi:hypothetical protein